MTHENHGLRIEAVAVNNKREVFLTIQEVSKIAQHCTKQAQAAIWAALLTGARRGELFKIRAEHIGADTITLPASHTKTLRMRVIPIIPALRPWLEYFPLEITVDGAKSAWRRARTKAGMEHVNFHDLRHSCASIMLGLGSTCTRSARSSGTAMCKPPSVTPTCRSTHNALRWANSRTWSRRPVCKSKLHRQFTQAKKIQPSKGWIISKYLMLIQILVGSASFEFDSPATAE